MGAPGESLTSSFHVESCSVLPAQSLLQLPARLGWHRGVGMMLQPSQATETPQKGKAASEDKAITRLQQWCLFKQRLFISMSTFGTQRRADPPTTMAFMPSVLAPSTQGPVVLVLGVEGWVGSSFHQLGLVSPQGMVAKCLGETGALGTSGPTPGASCC